MNVSVYSGVQGYTSSEHFQEGHIVVLIREGSYKSMVGIVTRAGNELLLPRARFWDSRLGQFMGGDYLIDPREVGLIGRLSDWSFE